MQRVGRRIAISGLIAVLALMSTSNVTLADYASAVLADNPLGYWRLNETADDTAVNQGTGGPLLDGLYIDGLQGAPGPDVLADGRPLLGMGAGNVAFEVGSDDSYMTVEESILSDLDKFTITGWVQLGFIEGGRIGLFGQNDVVEFGFNPSTTLNMWTPRGAITYEYDPDEIPEGSWFHVAAVGRPGSVRELYINGEPVARSGAFNFNIGGGGIWDATGNQFDGAVDEVAIWNVALTEAQVRAHVDAAVTAGGSYSTAVLADKPMGYWRLNETQGTTAVNAGTDGVSLNGEYVAGEQGYPGPNLPGMGANNVAYLVGPDESYVHLEASPLSGLKEFSMSGWVQAEPRAATRIGLWGQNDVAEFGFITAEELNIWSPSASMGNWNIFNDAVLGDKIDSGEWFHVAVTGAADGMRMYVDGEMVAENTGVSFDGSVGQTFGASTYFFNSGGGGIWDATGNQYTGTLDEIAVWDTDLTAAQIRAQFEAALGVSEPVLMAGDADQNLQFNQLDLVKVQIAAKYLTGAAATWGEGDWNGAPGGSPGNPPPGNGLFDQLDIIAALAGDVYLTGPYYPALAGPGQENDSQTSIIYNPGTGELAVDAPAGVELTSINIDSVSGIFTGAPATNLGGSFDNDADANIFKATFGSSFGSLSFGNVAAPGLSEEFVTADLTAVGSLAGGGALGAVDLIYVPEPSSFLLVCLGLVALVGFGRNHRRN